MTKRERQLIYMHTPDDPEPMCRNCRFYHPHYSLTKFDFGCGHCTEPRIKHRNAYDLCEKWKRREE